MDDHGDLDAMTLENLGRQDLSEIAEAQMFARYSELGMGQHAPSATCVLTHALVPKVGSPSRTTQTSSFQLAPAGNDRWVITRVTAGR